MAEISLPYRAGFRIEVNQRSIDCSLFRGGDYQSPEKSIVANIEVEKSEEIIYGHGEHEITVPVGGKYIEMHFSPPNGNVHVLRGNRHAVVENLGVGVDDYIDFLVTLQREKKFKDIKIIAGSTNRQLARLAVKRLGFHYCWDEDSIPPQVNQGVWVDPDEHVLFYGIVSELITKLPSLYLYKGKELR